MKQPSNIDRTRLNSLLRTVQKSIRLFAKQGHEDVYFTAQFIKGGRKQNCITRGDANTFSEQIRGYADSEDADVIKIEFFDEASDKSIYSKTLDLRAAGRGAGPMQGGNMTATGLGGYDGLGEARVRQMVAEGMNEERQKAEFDRLTQEVEALRAKSAKLESENEELETTLKAKKETEYYMGIIGAAFPGLAPLFSGSPLAQAASFLAGTTDLNGNALPTKQAAESETQSIAAMVSEFCNCLNTQEASAVHLLFVAFEKDRNQIQRALQFITLQPPVTA